jgi:hypothetical protein
MAKHPHAHEQFKVFVGTSVDDINVQIQAFSASGASPRSIGVDHRGGRYLVSLGYEKSPGASSVKLTSTNLGKLSLDAPEAIEAALSTASKAVENVICHELYSAPDGSLVAVFLSHG